MRRTKEEAQATKEFINNTAIQLFLKQGFSNTKLDQIAKATKMTRGAIYWHFKDKLDIVRALIDTEIQQLYDLMASVFQGNLPAHLKIKQIIKVIVHNFYDNKSFRDFIELTWFKMEYTQLTELFSSKAEPTVYFLKNFEKIVKAAQRSGHIRKDIKAKDIALSVTNLVNGMYRMYFLLPEVMATKKKGMTSFDNYLKLISIKV